ncbi:MAG: phosphoglycerate kinase [Patescibacteria group bacterium]
MQIALLRDAEVAGKRVLVRCDFDVPLKNLPAGRQMVEVADASRLKAAIPTITFLREHGAKEIILIGHVGRPDGKVVEELRVAPIEKKLGELTNMSGIVVKENLRFDPREEANDPTLAQELANLADIFVNESFATAHRAHASTVGVAKLLPSYAGLRFAEEVERLSQALTPPQGSVALIGGAKFETKQPLIEKLLNIYSTVMVGGALGNDMLKARGFPFGSSLISSTPVPTSIAGNERLLSPLDAAFMGGEMDGRTAPVTDTRADEKIVDLGPQTAMEWAKIIQEAPFVLWNGPMGVYEDGYTHGTDMLAGALASSSTTAIIGGGDTAAAVSKFTFDPKKIFISSGGGAMLDFLANGTLPTLDVLIKK